MKIINIHYHFVFILTFVVLFQNRLLAQEDIINVKPCKLVLNTGDTIDGTIKHKINMHQQIFFKSENENNFVEYSPSSVSAFFFDEDKYFLSIEVDSNGNRKFLQCLVEGYLSLYREETGSENRYYIKKEDDELVLLERTDTIITKYGDNSIAGVTYSKEEKRYIGKMKYYLRDCPELFPLMDNAKFSVKVFVKIVRKYNECKNQGVRTKDYLESTKIRLSKGVILGCNERKLGYPGCESSYYGDDFGLNYGYYGGIYIALMVKERLCLNPVLLVYTHKGDLEKTVFANTVNEAIEHTKLSFVYLRLPVLVCYKVSLKYFNPYISIGPVIGYAIKTVAYKEYDYSIRPSRNYREEMETDPVEFGYQYGIGIEKEISSSNTFFVQFHFSKTIANLNSINYKIMQKAFDLSMGISF